MNIAEIMNVYGSYVHGIFDGDGIAKTIVDSLLAKRHETRRCSYHKLC